MPRPRATEVGQRQSPRGPPNLRTSSSDSDPLHLRPRTERSPKLAEGRSPRSTQSNPLNQKKLGTRIADLESQLGLAQEELRSLKDQLVSTEAAKIAAQDQLEKKSKRKQKGPEALEIEEKLNKKDDGIGDVPSNDVEQETDVFEVPIEKVTVEEPKAEVEPPAEEDEFKPKSVTLSEPSAISEEKNPLFDELTMKNNEINLLKMNLDDKDKELEALRLENESLRNQLNEKSLKISSTQFEIDELVLKLDNVNQELEETKSSSVQISKKLEAAENANEELENEMKTLRVQTEQWRKAADAAAAFLAGGVEMNGRRISERCGSMDNNYANAFGPVGGYVDYVGSPGMIDGPDYVFGSEKRKGSGSRMFGDLWKKKGHK